MEFFHIRKDIPFMRHALKFNIISVVTFILAVAFIALRGLNLSVEFTGGTLLEISYPQPPNIDAIRTTLAEQQFPEVQVQRFGTASQILIRLPNHDAGAEGSSTPDAHQLSQRVMDVLTAASPDNPPTLNRAEFVGSQVGKEFASDGAMALLVVVVGIVLYLAMRFEWRFAIAAIIANLHDVIIIVGCFAFFQWEFSLPVLAAVLAVLGYSVNESVVVFDRVRETFRRQRHLTPEQVINHAITSTISRTIITHGSTQVMVLSMLIFGGEALHYFAVALTIGICFGIYSSVLVASPIALWLGVSRAQFVQPKKEKEEAVV